MQKHKKLLFVLLIILVFGLVGCSKASTSISTQDEVSTESDSSRQGSENSNVDNTESESEGSDKNDIDTDIKNESTDKSDEVDENLSTDSNSEIISTVKSNITSKISDNNTSESIKTEDSKNKSSDAEVKPSEKNSEISEEDIKFADKVKAFKLAAKRLSGDQISELMDMAKGGFTAEEKKRAKELFYKNFTDEEREWILKMYEQYY